MDLQKLQIDRSGSARKRRGGNPWIARLVALAVVAALVWLFHAPLMAQLDRWRLPKVTVAEVVKTTPMARASASGAAANGYVVARRRAALSADTPGRIVELNVEEGSVVNAGDVIARLFFDEYEAALRQADADLVAGRLGVETARARIAAAERRHEEATAQVANANARVDEESAAVELAAKERDRAKNLLDSGTDTVERLDRAQSALTQAEARRTAAESEIDRAKVGVSAAESDVRVAESELAEAEARLSSLSAARELAAATLDKTIVRAPFDGIIVLKDAEVGEVVSPNAQGAQSRGSVATMVDFASLEIQVELPETSLDSAEVGKRCEVFLDAFPRERFDGKVDRIWPTANRQKASVEVRVVLDAIDPRMRPDMGARVVFTGDAEQVSEEELKEALMIPSEALVRVDGTEGVFVVERDVVTFRPVQLGPGSGRRRVVEDGVQEGERVVLDPPARLVDGDRVQVQGG